MKRQPKTVSEKHVGPITAEVQAWISPYSSLGPEDIKPGMRMGALTFIPIDDDSSYYLREGYTRAGTAVITFTPLGTKEIISSKVESLRAQQTKAIADAQAKSTELEEKIQRLLAITYEPGA